MKTSSETTMSFIKSEFFRISLEISQNFRFVTNEDRQKDNDFLRAHKHLMPNQDGNKKNEN